MSGAEEIRFDHYRVERDEQGEAAILGRGAMGVTYRAVDTTLGRHVALKTIDASMLNTVNARQRFLLEARATASLHHRNIATIFHQGEVNGTCFYAMEYIDGVTLQKEVQKRGCLPLAEALALIRQAAQGLAEAERHGLVHRDIKPANIMLKTEADGERVAKLIDFGLVKQAAENREGEVELTMTGMYLGTAATSSPEQCRGEDLDTRSDMYSLGITLWFALTGEWPYFDDNLYRLIFQQTDSPLPLEKLKGQPQPVIELLECMLQKDREKRPRNCVTLIGLIDDCLRKTAGFTPSQEASRTARSTVADLPTRAGGAEDLVAPAPPKPKPRKALLVAGAVAAVAVVAAGVALVAASRKSPRDGAATVAAAAPLPAPAAAEAPAFPDSIRTMSSREALVAIAEWMANHPAGAGQALPAWLLEFGRKQSEPVILQRLGDILFATHRDQALDYFAVAATALETQQDYKAALEGYLDLIAKVPALEQAAAASSRVERVVGFLADDPGRITTDMLPILDRAARLPLPAAHLAIGRFLLPSDDRRAEAAFRQAADAGDANGMITLARQLRQRKDADAQAESAAWYARAAERNVPQGQYHRAVDLLEREGRTNDAIALLYAAVSNRNADAMTYLGALFCEGRGVEPSPLYAHKLFDDAIAAGDAYACGLKAALLMRGQGQTKDEKLAIELLQRGAGQTNRLCLFYLGMAYYYGDGVAKDESRGRTMLAQSAKLGEPRAGRWLEQNTTSAQ